MENTMKTMVTVDGVKALISIGHAHDVIECANLFLQYTRMSVKTARIQNLLLDNDEAYETVARKGYSAFATIEEKVDIEKNTSELEKMIIKRDFTLLNATKKLLWLSSICKQETGITLLTKKIDKQDAAMCDRALLDFLTAINSLKEENASLKNAK